MASLGVASPALAADVTDVAVTPESGGTYRFDVTIRSDEIGWDKFADRWEVPDTDGAVPGARVPHHPHVDEQPFTRSLSGAAVPERITSVTLRARDSVEGFVGAEMPFGLPDR